jgi:hypothetical protein
MKLGEITSLIIQRKSGGTPDRMARYKYDDRVVRKYMDIARRDIMVDLMAAGGVTDDFIKTFYPYLLWNKSYRYAYANIPASLIQLPENKGLLYVSGIEDDESWDILDNLSWQTYKNMESGMLTGRPAVYVEGNSIICPTLYQSQANRCIKVRLFCDSNGYTENEEFPVPIKSAVYVDMVCRLMDEMKATPVKTANDGNPNTP